MTTVMGLDIGGSSTILAVRSSGEDVLRLRGPGANPRSSDSTYVEVVSQLLDEITARMPPETVERTHIGMAGYHGRIRPRITADLERVWAAKGFGHSPTISSDLEIAYCSVRSTFPGLLLLAGTGSVACRVDTRMEDEAVPHIARQVDGWGWKLGDGGSGLDMGWRAMRHLARVLDGRESPSLLADLLIADLELSGLQRREDLLTIADSTSIAHLAAFAPMVFAAAAGQDRHALHIVEVAARELVDKLHPLIDEEVDDVVVAGSILTRETPVAIRVSDLIVSRGFKVHCAPEPVVGALTIASGATGRRF